GIVLLVLDIILPVPGTLVMSGLGYVYGVFIGGIVAGLGSFISGAAGYWLCRSFGKGGAVKILGEKDFNRGTETFNRVGGWLVVLSRWLPVFPEVISCMAGLNRMSILKFHLALLVSSIPLGFVFAYIGSVGDQHPLATVILSIVLPVIIWLIVTPIFNRHRKTI
ncbi:MAG: VTT domain-containing protein, partial [Saprospiraceae bacterium]|nr:VTT domain-containing protein [Saprospiraceae bacterium]